MAQRVPADPSTTDCPTQEQRGQGEYSHTAWDLYFPVSGPLCIGPRASSPLCFTTVRLCVLSLVQKLAAKVSSTATRRLHTGYRESRVHHCTGAQCGQAEGERSTHLLHGWRIWPPKHCRSRHSPRRQDGATVSSSEWWIKMCWKTLLYSSIYSN